MGFTIVEVDDPDQDGFTIGALDTLILLEGVFSSASVSGVGLDSTQAGGVFGADLFNHGFILSETNGIDFFTHVFDGNAHNSITNEATGTISADITGIRLGGTQNLVVNHGRITAHRAIEDLGGNNRFTNSGSIEGTVLGLSLGSFSQLFNAGRIEVFGDAILVEKGNVGITNTGTIRAGDAALRLTGGLGTDILNEGLIDSAGVGAVIKVGGNSLTNLGTLHAALGGLLVSIKDPGVMRFDNRGVLSSDDGRAYVSVGSSTDRLFNDGSILGAVDTGGEADVVDNSGTLRGILTLGDGNDIYRGLGQGRVSAQVFGGAGLDQLSGGDLDDRLDGGAGNDLLVGGGGIDALTGGLDNDALLGEGGTDLLSGGDGNDSLRGGADDDAITGGEGADTALGGAGDDQADGGRGNDRLGGGQGEDELTGGAGDDLLAGSAGEDTLRGAEDQDVLQGGAGDDLLDGGSGKDTLQGGSGEDLLIGGKDADLFQFTRASGTAEIADFQQGLDLIELRGMTSDFSLLAQAIGKSGAGAVIDLAALGGSGSVLLLGVDATLLTAGDFLF